MALYGYARVSSADQNPQLQIDALTAAGCEIHIETGSGAKADRPVLTGLLDGMQPGDGLVSWKFDRIGRDAWHLLSIVRELEARGCVYRSLTEGLDSSTTFGRFGLQILAAVAEMERATTKERQLAGIAAARRAGRAHGRPPGLGTRDHRASLRHGLRRIQHQPHRPGSPGAPLDPSASHERQGWLRAERRGDGGA